MSATLKPDGTIEFGSPGLLDMRTITNMAFRMLVDSRAKADAVDQDMRLRELRKSCGAENPPLRIKMPDRSK